MKDYLEAQGVVISPVTPRNVVKEAFAAKLIRDAQVWLDMLDHRNLLSHTYDRGAFEDAVEALNRRYLAALEELHDWLMQRNLEP